jgi:hypothetical protein
MRWWPLEKIMMLMLRGDFLSLLIVDCLVSVLVVPPVVFRRSGCKPTSPYGGMWAVPARTVIIH